MKKIILSAFIILAFVLYSIFYQKGTTATALPVNTSTTTPTSTTQNTSSTASTSNTSSSQTYKDGTYTGTRANAYYGYIQVKATISNGRITDIQFLEYPNGHHESVQINKRAMPLLKQEAITAQSADVDGVSRATDTSLAFIESLSQALAEAKL